MKFGYARISTPKQSLENQISILENEGCDKIFSDVISGYNSVKKEFERMMDQIRKGDSIIVTGIDRLGRSTKDLSILLDDLHKKEIDLVIVGYDFDTRTAAGRMIFNFMAMIAENERMRNIERIHQAMHAARKKGKLIGRPKKITLEQKKQLNKIYKEKILSTSELCLTYNISRPTLYKYIDELNCNTL